jgi:hypothetical protein
MDALKADTRAFVVPRGRPIARWTTPWVWRADYKMAGEELPPLINRLVLWRAPGGTLLIQIGYFQDIDPLPSE